MEDIVKEYKSKNESKIRNLASNMGVGHIVLIGICVFIIIAITSNKEIDTRYHYVGYAILILVIIVLIYKPSKERKLLPKKIILGLAQEEVNRMVREGREFAYDSKVLVGPACHLNWINDNITNEYRATHWDVGVLEFVHGTQYKKEGVIMVHPYEGIIEGFDWRPLGYDGRQSRDKEIIPVGVFPGNPNKIDLDKNTNKVS